jgi:hypothetical protein
VREEGSPSPGSQTSGPPRIAKLPYDSSLETSMRPLRSLRVIPVVLIAIALLPSTIVAQDKSVDLTGKWLFTVTTDAGTGTPTVTLAQKGDSLTGHYSSQVLGESELKGSVKDQKFTFTFRTDVQGTTLVVTYSGTVESKEALKGTVDLGGMGNGTFTAKRM